MTTIYENPNDTAKKIRKELKAEFKGIKFSVRTSKYTGGSSITITWENGPLTKAVQKIANKFQSTTFDGMIDMATSHGYEYNGQIFNGADYIFTRRELSDDHKAKIVAQYKADFTSNMWEDLTEWDLLSEAMKHEAGDIHVIRC